MRENFKYFEKDGVYFRRTTQGQVGIDDVLTSRGWEPYAGDCVAPVYFGDSISEEQMKMVLNKKEISPTRE